MLKFYDKSLLLTGCCIFVTSCSLFTPASNYPTIPLAPPQSNESSASSIDLPNVITTESNTIESTVPNPPISYKHTKIISEERSNGQVRQIKVQNGRVLPDYYIYPSQQQSINSNNTPGKSLATPSWQINW